MNGPEWRGHVEGGGSGIKTSAPRLPWSRPRRDSDILQESEWKLKADQWVKP